MMPGMLTPEQMAELTAATGEPSTGCSCAT